MVVRAGIIAVGGRLVPRVRVGADVDVLAGMVAVGGRLVRRVRVGG